MKDSKLRFSNRVENYIRYRPNYPKQIVADLEFNGVLKKDAIIADIGSGTGISTELFLSQGYHCLGVEPNKEMREAAERMLKRFDTFRSVNGNAEASGLNTHSVDLITAGQAFHWFDRKAAKIEFQRILRPGAYVALIWNERHHTGSAFQSGYEALLKDYCGDYTQVDYKNVDEAALKRFFSPNTYSIYEYQNSQTFDCEGLKGRLESSSYCPLPDSKNYEPLMKALVILFENEKKDSQITFEYRTRVYVGQLTQPTN
jgi:ubiquinone/menaquinone biosynthesis C-methylase UbiE